MPQSLLSRWLTGSVDSWMAGGKGRLVPLAGKPKGTLAELAELKTGCWGSVGWGGDREQLLLEL